MDIEISTDQMMLSGCDIGLLGHIHSPQKLGDRFFYSGGIYPVKVDEQQCGFMLHEFGNIAGIETHFIPTPFTKTVRFQQDFTLPTKEIVLNELLPGQVEGAHVRYEVTMWQDEVSALDKSELIDVLTKAGALSVDIRVTLVPRENIRAASVLEAETLRDEVAEMAKLRGEPIDPEILVMADRLENVPGEELLKEVAA